MKETTVQLIWGVLSVLGAIAILVVAYYHQRQVIPGGFPFHYVLYPTGSILGFVGLSILARHEKAFFTFLWVDELFRLASGHGGFYYF